MFKKKSFFAILMAAVLVVPVMFAACSKKSNKKEEKATAAKYDTSKIEQTIATMKETGYLFTYKTTANGESIEMTYGAKGNIFYHKIANEEMYVDLSSDTEGVLYTYNSATESWTKTVIRYEDVSKDENVEKYDQAFEQLKGCMTVYDNPAIKNTPAVTKDVVIAGRECENFTVSISMGGESMSYSFAIDKETGICMKYSVTVSGEDLDMDISIECTQFSTNWVPQLPEV